MKTKEQVIDGFLERFCTFDAGTHIYNRIKSAIEGVWKNGYANGREEGFAAWAFKGLSESQYNAEKEAEYNRGYEDGSKKKVMETLFEVAEDKQQELIDQGKEIAWNLARQIVLDVQDGGFEGNTLVDIFGVYSGESVLKRYTVHEAEEKVREYKEKVKECEEKKTEESKPITNADKLKEVFGFCFDDAHVFMPRKSWLNAEYKEPYHDDSI